ncbi:hypothetical protein [Mucilaginibacter sp. KACC 22063]|uniref:hypothetical protein n=1 Tax=Mucilaginibacter sp. KACC 22063 TaxID=3025666 RepID=UPI002366A010|nr:hypothetical protein [Mucilaginibacter sp. KACC 22063]WDF56382.1 hypothetical protein PQ461_04865 [Mucilaginibacter sp. KACC 22063]
MDHVFAGEVYRDRCKNVMDGYLKYYLKVTPGNTLGIVHASEITVKCTGKKSLMSNRMSKL